MIHRQITDSGLSLFILKMFNPNNRVYRGLAGSGEKQLPVPDYFFTPSP